MAEPLCLLDKATLTRQQYTTNHLPNIRPAPLGKLHNTNPVQCYVQCLSCIGHLNAAFESYLVSSPSAEQNVPETEAAIFKFNHLLKNVHVCRVLGKMKAINGFQNLEPRLIHYNLDRALLVCASLQ